MQRVVRLMELLLHIYFDCKLLDGFKQFDDLAQNRIPDSYDNICLTSMRYSLLRVRNRVAEMVELPI